MSMMRLNVNVIESFSGDCISKENVTWSNAYIESVMDTLPRYGRGFPQQG